MNKWKVLSSNKNIESEDDVIEELLSLRNISKSQIEKFLNPDISDLKIEKSGIDLTELKKANKRIKEAIKNNEKIIILGDYDVDGICASAILWETIYSKYKNVFPYIPDRFTEGYGISKKSIDNILEKYPEVKLIVTVDNGIVAEKPISYAKKKGIDVIVTDHHIASEKKPDAYAIVHTTNLCGAAVAWMVAYDLSFLEEDEINEKLSLVTLATVADLVPLVDLNRVIVTQGLNYLKKTKRPGLLEIYKLAGINKEQIGTYQIGHIIAPRLNATGRIYHAMDSLRLLCSSDKKFASQMAQKLELTNKKRQQMVIESVQHAKLSVISKDLEGVIVVQSESYSEGVVGLISSRLVEEYYRPVFAISVGEKISKGSARSIAGINIIELLRSVSHLLEEVGGHPMAAGFSLKNENIDDFSNALKNKLEEIEEDIFTRSINIDMEISEKLITKSLFKKIQKLSPFGIGNYEPTFLTSGFEVKNKRFMGKDNSHLKITLEKNNKIFEAVGFGIAQDFNHEIGERIDLVYKIDLNSWNGNEKLQLKIRDFN